ncbi:GIY-YIG nuclease family protein [Patescibacteria group bacterium]|nr:GIY-YIG nuclease family protein [Patescibacteria group bacterium]
MPFVYILTNKSNTLYVGSTKDLKTRIRQHSRINNSHFTNKYHINKLIYFKEFDTVKEAVFTEKKIKGWTRKKKIALIKTINPEFSEILR